MKQVVLLNTEDNEIWKAATYLYEMIQALEVLDSLGTHGVLMIEVPELLVIFLAVHLTRHVSPLLQTKESNFNFSTQDNVVSGW